MTPPPGLSVVIATYNRRELVERCIQSALSQKWAGLEIIVVDDASTSIEASYPEVKYIRQMENRGPGAARNAGLRFAARDWVIIIDDDDEFETGAFARIAQALTTIEETDSYPVVQFACSNGSLGRDGYHLVRLEDYLLGRVTGDFTPVIRRDLFLGRSLTYPPVRIGGEHLLWWRVARDFGIPSWAGAPVVKVGAGAPSRLTSTSHQLRRAAEFARLQEMTLEQFGDILNRDYPVLARRKSLGAATYHLLAGNRGRARTVLRETGDTSLHGLALYVLTFLPTGTSKALFRQYRRATTILAPKAGSHHE
jgi:glycosyltransferase involved in cell wall biosynthesis